MICPNCKNQLPNRWDDHCPHCIKIQKMDRFYMDIAVRASELSHGKRLQVGAVLVKDNNILSFGWNGTPPGFDNCCETDDNATKPEVIHAEVNTLAKVARTTGNALNSTLYLTDSPCYDCCKLVIQSGVKRVVYLCEYRITDPIDFMRRAGIIVVQLV